MYKCQNGWTKAKMIECIKERNNGTGAYDVVNYLCQYETDAGNHCAVGCFIPEGHEAMLETTGVKDLIKNFPDLQKVFPLGVLALNKLQAVHDEQATRGLPVRNVMLDWIEKNVKD